MIFLQHCQSGARDLGPPGGLFGLLSKATGLLQSILFVVHCCMDYLDLFTKGGKGRSENAIQAGGFGLMTLFLLAN